MQTQAYDRRRPESRFAPTAITSPARSDPHYRPREPRRHGSPIDCRPGRRRSAGHSSRAPGVRLGAGLLRFRLRVLRGALPRRGGLQPAEPPPAVEGSRRARHRGHRTRAAGTRLAHRRRRPRRTPPLEQGARPVGRRSSRVLAPSPTPSGPDLAAGLAGFLRSPSPVSHARGRSGGGRLRPPSAAADSRAALSPALALCAAVRDPLSGLRPVVLLPRLHGRPPVPQLHALATHDRGLPSSATAGFLAAAAVATEYPVAVIALCLADRGRPAGARCAAGRVPRRRRRSGSRSGVVPRALLRRNPPHTAGRERELLLARRARHRGDLVAIARRSRRIVPRSRARAPVLLAVHDPVAHPRRRLSAEAQERSVPARARARPPAARSSRSRATWLPTGGGAGASDLDT